MTTQSGSAVQALSPILLHKRPSFWETLLQTARRKPLGAISVALIAILVLAAVFADVVAPYDPLRQSILERLKAPSAHHLLGTDELGRDVLSRLIHGARISIWIGLMAVTLGTGIGAIIGLITGYWGGVVDLVLQRIMDSIMAFPTLILAMAILAMLGQGTTNAMLAIAITIIPGNSRVIRGAVLSVKQNQYVEAARAMGCTDLRIVLRHVLPNVGAPIVILVSVWMGNAVLVETSLSFLGLGTVPPNPSWGSMLSGAGRTYMEQAPWLAIFPGAAISLLVLAFNLLGDTLRDIWDPRLRGRV